jgi:hypothetical protein
MDAAQAGYDEYTGQPNPPASPPAPPVATAFKDGGGSIAAIKDRDFYVLDTTALPGTGVRRHEMPVIINNHLIVKTFEFRPGEPTKLPMAIAIKFLKIKEFLLTDEHGNPLPYQRQPKQPDELGAGEKFTLEDHLTVADYNELTNVALMQRVLELPGGEALRDTPNRRALIDFIIKAKVTKREANREREAQARAARARAAVAEEIDSEDFTPEPELDEGAA